jgi:hypothetical protein
LHCLGKISPEAIGNRLDAQSNGEMCFPHARRTEENDILPVTNKPAPGQFLDPFFVGGIDEPSFLPKKE